MFRILKYIFSLPLILLSIASIWFAIDTGEILGGIMLALLFAVAAYLPWAKSGLSYTFRSSALFSVFFALLSITFIGITFELIDSNWWYEPGCKWPQSRAQLNLCFIYGVINPIFGKLGMRIMALIFAIFMGYLTYLVAKKVLFKNKHKMPPNQSLQMDAAKRRP